MRKQKLRKTRYLAQFHKIIKWESNPGLSDLYSEFLNTYYTIL